MKPVILRALLVGALILPAAQAQSCATLSTSWDPATAELTATVTGATADSFTILVVGQNPGTATVGGATLGLAQPFFPVFLGQTDANGDLSVVRRPPAIPAGVTVYMQSATLSGGGGSRPGGGPGTGGGGPGGRPGGGGSSGGGPSSLVFCVSNVTSIAFP